MDSRTRLERCLGGCIGACITGITYLHDRYTDCRWNRHGTPDFLTDLQTYSGNAIVSDDDLAQRSVHTAVVDRNASEALRIVHMRPEAAMEQNAAGETALHLACRLGYIDVMDELLNNNCPCVTTAVGSPMHCVLLALRSGYVPSEAAGRALERLAGRGCNLDAQRGDGRTAALLCSEQSAWRHLDTLIGLGCDLSICDSNHFSPLYAAAIRGDIQCVSVLLRHQTGSASVDQRDTEGRTPLIAALLSIVNTYVHGKMPTDRATKFDMPRSRQNLVAVAEALLQAGANPNAQDSFNRSALVCAFNVIELDWKYSAALAKRAQKHNGTVVRSGSASEGSDSIFSALVRLLIQAGARAPVSWHKDYSTSPEWVQLLLTYSLKAPRAPSKPSSLQQLARHAIRAQVALVGRLGSLQQVPLPPTLAAYVCVKYV